LGRDSEDGILLYGTNAVGKSSLIKSIGICVILAQAGFFVPCSNFVYKPYKKLFTRILGNDNLFKGLSTFAVEMSELRVILKNSGQDSLVLGDEVCSGTETISAISIFLSALLTLHEKNSSFIFATHLHEIVKMDYLKKIDRTKMMHMAIRCDSHGVIIYDRKLKAGSGSNIYGLEVCKSLHMPNDFLAKAHEIRRSIYPEDKEIMSANKTRYNSNKIKGNCELCGEKAIDVHHMVPQKESNDNKFIGSFHQNHAANLMNLCKQCHNKETISNRKLRKTKTSEGMKDMETF
jgi:DNA mismatch repair protein MutS